LNAVIKPFEFRIVRSFFGIGFGVERQTQLDDDFRVHRAIHWKAFFGPIIICGTINLGHGGKNAEGRLEKA